MNQGPLIFLGVLVALLASWFGLVFQPYVQLGNVQPETRTSGESELYPVPRSGEAMHGLQLYRSLGCATCHSQQVRQSGAEFDVVLSKSGTNLAELVIAMVAVNDDLTPPEAGRLAERAPVTVVEGTDEDTALAAVELLRKPQRETDRVGCPPPFPVLGKRDGHQAPPAVTGVDRQGRRRFV